MGPFSKQTEISTIRAFDASANRAREGLRVVEDSVRFILDDRFLTEQLKQLRHDLAATLSKVPIDRRLTSRETQADVGTSLTTDSERLRNDIADILTSNFMRLQEALRSLEEFSKVFNANMSSQIKRIRYLTYTLHRTINTIINSNNRLENVRLYVLIDGQSSLGALETLVKKLTSSGVHAIQLRDKMLNDRELLERAKLLRQLTRAKNVLFVVNDRPDIALLARADGVHIGQEELSVKDTRSIVSVDSLIGVSTHSIAQARQAVLDGANYIGVGPVFQSQTKNFEKFHGVELLESVADEISLPAFAIGGINQENICEVTGSGFNRIAVSDAVTSSDDIKTTARTLLDKLAGK